MIKLLKRLSVLLLSLSLLLTSVPAVSAARIDAEGREIRYGTIEVLGIGQKKTELYKAARDDTNGLVYIHADDFAALTGASLRKSGKYEDWYYHYTLDCWHVEVQTDDGIAHVTYDFDPERNEGIGYPLYEQFELTDCLYDPYNECWYFPFEEMMYMMALEWQCEKGIVLIYQPETLLDIMEEYDTMLTLLPSYQTLMGEDGWDRVTSAWNYGWAAAIDELDMNFLWEGIESAWASAWGKPFFTDYEKDTLLSALMLMQSDVPDAVGSVSGGMDWVSDFVGAAATVLDLTDEGVGFEVAHNLISDILGISVSAGQMDALSKAATVGAPLLGYALSVGQTQWVRDNVSADLDDRLVFIQNAAEERSERDPFWELTAEIAGEARSKYCSEIAESCEKIPADSLATMADGILTISLGDNWKDDLTGAAAKALKGAAPEIAGTAIDVVGSGAAIGLTFLNWMNLAVGTMDLCVEVAKDTSPTFASALEAGENAHLCRYLIHISKLTREENDIAYRTLKGKNSVSQELLDEIRLGVQLMMTSSLHANDLLQKLGKYTAPAGGFAETEYLVRLLESAKHDKLLLMDRKFRNLESGTPGCIRQDIPVEYVRVIDAVVVTKETVTITAEHFEATIERPIVYAEANKNLTAIVDATLEDIYTEIYDAISKEKVMAASCTYRRASHQEYVHLTSAYSNGGFLSINLRIGCFYCDIGHNMNSDYTYLFDIASGAVLSLPSLLDTANNPDAEAALIQALDAAMKATGKCVNAEGRPTPVTAEKVYRNACNNYLYPWDLTPNGLRFNLNKSWLEIMIGSVTIPYSELEGIFQERYLPAEIKGTATCTFEPFRQELWLDSGRKMYTSAPSVNSLHVNGQVSSIWITDYLGSVPEINDGRSTQAYAFGVQNCTITLPAAALEKYGYLVTWQDEEGEHSQVFPANP